MSSRHLLAAGMMVCLCVFGVRGDEKKADPDRAKLLVGKWEVSKAGGGLSVGSVLDFDKDGKLKATVKERGAEQTVNARYKLEGDTLAITLVEGKKEEKKDEKKEDKKPEAAKADDK